MAQTFREMADEIEPTIRAYHLARAADARYEAERRARKICEAYGIEIDEFDGVDLFIAEPVTRESISKEAGE